jgi:uncharacterized oxidoreductase
LSGHFGGVLAGDAEPLFRRVKAACRRASKAAIHMLTESVRLQLADTMVKLKELEPPAVQTDLLPGQRESDWAVTLDEFVDDVIHLLEMEPDSNEIQVERVKFLRYAEVRGGLGLALGQAQRIGPNCLYLVAYPHCGQVE